MCHLRVVEFLLRAAATPCGQHKDGGGKNPKLATIVAVERFQNVEFQGFTSSNPMVQHNDSVELKFAVSNFNA
jgi:hypothetical protein